MNKWTRVKFQPNLPLRESGRVTASKEHILLSKEAAKEGMVLLKNEKNLLPLTEGTRIALFGKGSFDYVKGGGGSGDVMVSYVHNLYDGLKMQENAVQIYEPLSDFYRTDIRHQYEKGAAPGMTVEPELSQELADGAKAFADVAVVVISRFSGEGWDRKSVRYEGQVSDEGHQSELSEKIFQNSDFCLTNEEAALVAKVKEKFDRIVVVLNVGGMVDTSWFIDDEKLPAVLMAWQGGMEGGLAAADVVTGDVNPSGKLVDTYAATLEDYPSTENFHKSVYYVDYNEDIYVGYRYFETIPGAAEKVNYPFGFGLSYTSFETEVLGAEEKDGKIVVKAAVTNTGKRAGKEVVQLYYGAPQGKLGKPAKELGAYRKTRLLQPGETQRVVLSFTVEDMASFDDLGKVAKSAYVLEAGSYVFYVGNNVRDAKKLDFTYDLAETKVTAQYTSLAAPHKLEKRLLADGTYEALPTDDGPVEEEGLERQDKLTLEGFLPAVKAQERKSFGELMEAAKTNPNLMNVVEGKETLDEFVDKLPTEALIHLLGGQPNTGVANTFGMGNLPEYGIPNIMTADGPAGLRIQPQCGVNTTAWPCATLLACTWDPELIEEIGKAGGEEVKENNIGIWLTPAVNIHRSPLCGRNFEYYSEDPLVAGKCAAAMTIGVQKDGKGGTTIKHFAANNLEDNRMFSNNHMSERALREIYLKGFEIAVKEAQPLSIMTSYNLINGLHTANSHDLIQAAARDEWGFEGVVMTDWFTSQDMPVISGTGHIYPISASTGCVYAGNDLQMPGCQKNVDDIVEAVKTGKELDGYRLTLGDVQFCVTNLLRVVAKVMK